MTAEKPVPETHPSTAEFWDRLTDGEFCIQACDDCGEVGFPPRRYCVHCYSQNWHFEAIDGGGTVYGYTVIHRASDEKYDTPVVSAVVELEEGPRVMGRVDCDPSEVTTGAPVRLDPSNLSDSDVRVTFELR
jgi:hypothetical protein